MKKIIIFILVGLSKLVSSQTTIFSEHFSGTSLPTGWARTASWTVTSGGATGSTSAYCYLPNTTSGTATNTLFTSTFNATAGFSYHLTYFDVATSGNSNSLNIYVSNLNPTAQNIANTNASSNFVNGTNSSTTSTSYVAQTSLTWVCPATGVYFFAFNGTVGSTARLRLDVITLIETPPTCTPPTIQASALTFPSVGNSNVNLSWTNGNGDNVLVVAKKTSSVTTDPVNFTNYTANSIFGNGTQIGTGNFVVYKGAGTSCSVTALEPDVNYTFSLYTFNQNSGSPCYNSNEFSGNTTPIFNRNFYVNDASLTGDIYCSVVGNISNSGKSPNSPKLTLDDLLTTYSGSFLAGDTIFIDAGDYSDKDLSSPINGVVIKGAGNTKTVFSNPGADNYFMRINDNNTVISDIKLVDYDDEGGGVGQTIGVIANTIGVRLLNIIVDAGTTSFNTSGHPIDIASGASVIIDGGGSTCNNWDGGGGIRVLGATTNVTIRNYAFVGNENIWSNGTALRVVNGTVNVYNSIFMNNESGSGMLGAGLFVGAGTVNVIDCLFDANSTYLATNSVGGTIYIAGGTVKIARSIIKNHDQLGGSTSYGAGIGVAGGSVTIDSCSFSSNVGSTTRGTDFYNDGGIVVIRDCTFGTTSNNIGCAGGTTTITFSGTPSSDVSFRTNLSITANSPRYLTSPNVPTVSVSCASIIVLPVELIDFSGYCKENLVTLSWTTASERNNELFYVHKLNASNEFELIGTIYGAGSTSSISNYTFEDRFVGFGNSVYMLSQQDFDGNLTELKTIVVSNNCLSNENQFNIYQQNENTIVIQATITKMDDVTFEIIDMTGKIIQQDNARFTKGTLEMEIPLTQSISNGIYTIRLYGSNTVYNQRINLK